MCKQKERDSVVFCVSLVVNVLSLNSAIPSSNLAKSLTNKKNGAQSLKRRSETCINGSLSACHHHSPSSDPIETF